MKLSSTQIDAVWNAAMADVAGRGRAVKDMDPAETDAFMRRIAQQASVTPAEARAAFLEVSQTVLGELGASLEARLLQIPEPPAEIRGVGRGTRRGRADDGAPQK